MCIELWQLPAALVLISLPLLANAQGQVIINAAEQIFISVDWRISHWIQEAEPLELNYQSICNGGGVKQFTKKGDFRASVALLP